MIRAGILGVTGYTGGELVRILLGHPEVKIAKAASRSNAGKEVANVHKGLYKCIDLVEEEFNPENFAENLDVVFLALPHGTSAEATEIFLKRGIKVIDLGADFRLKSRSSYEKWYELEHPCPGLLQESVYGLPELKRAEISKARLVANPGCYPTASILGLAPLLKNKLIKEKGIIIDAKSGVSGAGKTLSEQTHFPNMQDNFLAYKLSGHRHSVEIEQELSEVAETEVILNFTPHLVPMNRGILATIYAEIKDDDLKQKDIEELFREFYKDDYFIRQRSKNEPPQTKWVQGTNFCDLAPLVDERTNRVIVLSAIDNLVKGAAGEAIQNMNLLFDLPEELGLNYPGLFP